METLPIMVIVIAALVGIGILFSVYYIYKAKRKGQPEVRDTGSRIKAAQRRAGAAEKRATEWRSLAAQRRAEAAGERARATAIRRAQGTFFEFFVQHPIAWGSSWSFLVSVIGVNYSWGFYQRLDIHIFDFFSTQDFLLSAFQNIAMLIIGVFLALAGIGLFFFLDYNLSIDRAHDFSRDGQESRVRREAVILFSITLVSIVLLSLFVLFFSWRDWPAASIGPVLYSPIILVLALFFYRSIKKLASSPVSAATLPYLILVPLGAILIPFLSWWRFPQVSSKGVLYSITLGLFCFLVGLAYRFIILASSSIRRAEQVRMDERILVFIILVEAVFIVPFLWGGVDSHAALEDASRSVKVTLHKNALQPETRLPRSEQTLFLGTTSSFHFFYECEKPETGSTAQNNNSEDTPGGRNGPTAEYGPTDKTNWWDATQSWVLGWWNTSEKGNSLECKNGRPFITPTANIVSLEFNPKEDLPPHVGLPAVVKAIADLDTIINKLKLEEIEVPSALARINKIIGSINSSETYTKLIIPEIESLKPESVADFGPDKVAAAIVAFQSYLEGKTPITHLNATIKALNATIKALNRVDTPNPDLANVADAITTHASQVSTAIGKLNPCGIVDAIDNNTAEITDAIDDNTIIIADTLDDNTVVIADTLDDNTVVITKAIKELYPEVQNQCAQGLREMANIGPFSKEAHDQLEDSKELERLSDLFAKLERLFTTHTLRQLVLVGRTDFKPLRRKKRRFYGSNDGLAQARARWIRDRLIVRFPEHQEEIEQATLLLNAGPLHIGEVSEGERDFDRSVEVWACWTRNASEQASAPGDSE